MIGKLYIVQKFKETWFMFFFLYCRNVVKSFYSASLIFDILTVFGELNDEVRS